MTEPTKVPSLLDLSDPNRLIDQMQRMMAAYPLPGVDTGTMMKAYQEMIEAAARANQTALEGFSTLLRRQTEILQETFQETAKAMQGISQASTSPNEALARGAEFAQSSISRTISSIREAQDMALQSYRQAMDHVLGRVNTQLNEIRESAIANRPKT